MPKLTAKKVKSLTAPGYYADGGCLYLRVRPSGRSWVVRAVLHGKRVERSIGPEWSMSLAEARAKANEWRALMRDGIDPGAATPSATTFEAMARRFHEVYAPTWVPAHAARWIAQLEARAFPVIGHVPLDKVTAAMILEAVAPIWTTRHDTARTLLQRISVVFEFAHGAGVYKGLNPATGVRRVLPKVKPKVEHRRALPWQEIPGFYAELVQRDAMSALALRFLILTAARSGEARGARWAEIDLEAATWTVPAARMKMRQDHRVPLSAEALGVLEVVRGLDPVFVFPTPAREAPSPLSINAFRPLFARMGREVTVHGFRTSFRSWAAEAVRADREIAELCLAHRIGNAVEQAYQRSDLLERRRRLIDLWAAHVTGAEAPAADVVQLIR